MFNRAQDSFPLETAKLTFREALAEMAIQGLTPEEIKTEFDSAISNEFGPPAPQPLTSVSEILRGQLLGSFPGQ